MKFDFDTKLTKLNGEAVPVRTLVGGVGELGKEKANEIADALVKVGLPASMVNYIIETTLNKNDESLTLGEALKTLLLEGVEEKDRAPDGSMIPKQISPREKIERGKLAEKLWDGGVVDIDDEERDLAKDLSSAILGTELAFLIDRALDEPIVSDGDDDPDDEPATTRKTTKRKTKSKGKGKKKKS